MAGPSQAGADGVTRMVEVGEKAETAREAIAECFVSMEPEAVRHLLAGTKKGDPIATAKIAGVIGVKETPRLLPHCHPIRVTGAPPGSGSVAPGGGPLTALTASSCGPRASESVAMLSWSA